MDDVNEVKIDDLDPNKVGFIDQNFFGVSKAHPFYSEEEFKEEEFPIILDEKGKPKSNGKRNKAAGHGWEYTLIKYLKSVGYLDVVSTRGNSKFLDAQKVDIMNKDERKNGFLPFNLQAKTSSKPTPYPLILSEMPKGDTPNVIAFKYTRKATSKFMSMGEYALMDLKTWLYYIEIERSYRILRENNDTLQLAYDKLLEKYENIQLSS